KTVKASCTTQETETCNFNPVINGRNTGKNTVKFLLHLLRSFQRGRRRQRNISKESSLVFFRYKTGRSNTVEPGKQDKRNYNAGYCHPFIACQKFKCILVTLSHVIERSIKSKLKPLQITVVRFLFFM